MRTALALALAACAGSSNHPFEPPVGAPVQPPSLHPDDLDGLANVIAQALGAATVVQEGPYAADIRSVKVRTSTVLRKEPRLDADKVGIIAGGTRAAILHAVSSDGCNGRWIELAPRGWLCERAVEPSREAPTPAAPWSLGDGDRIELSRAVPGVYGYVHGKDVQAFATPADASEGANGRTLAGTNSVRATGTVTIDGRRYWKTTTGELIDASAIGQFSPSSFHGVALERTSLPAWVRGHRKPSDPVQTRTAAGDIVRSLAPRTVVTIAETSSDRTLVRIGADEWIARDDLRVASLAAPPPGTGPDEKWFDIDLDEQVLVAYEGERPVYATLVSTGKSQHDTPTGVMRIAAKHERAAMSSDKLGEAYAVADVPWTMYYDGDFALHTSYWHDGFGGIRSHGCVNLAPRDALLLYRWSSPDVPPGWTTVYGDADNPGSIVRVRSSKVPEPPFRGYARTMRDVGAARLAVR